MFLKDLLEEDNILKNIDMSPNLTPTESRPQLGAVHNIKGISESTMSGLNTRNENNNPNIKLQKGTVIIKDQEIFDNDNMFEDNDIFENIDLLQISSASRLPAHPSHDNTIKRIAESAIQDDKTGNNNINANTEPQDDTLIIESQEICNNGIFHLESDKDDYMFEDDDDIFEDDDDIFEDDDDIFDDIKIRNNVTYTKSNLQLDDVLQTTPESNIQIMEENDIYTANVLKYFRLNRISDIFQNSDVGSFIKERVDNVKGKKMSLLPKTGSKQDKCNVNQINATKVERSASPSLLSNRSTSPILISQKRKINLSINKHKNKQEQLLLSDNTRPISFQNKTSMSPLTEPEHRKTMKSLQQDTNEIIVLDSDDENFDDDFKDTPQLKRHTTIKRKFQEELDHKSESPYFRKKLKLNENCGKPSTIKEKIIAALASHQNPDESFHNNIQINCMTTTSPTFKLEKENRDPLSSDKIDKEYSKSKVEMLEICQHETKSKSKAILYERAINVPSKINIDDDDFETKVPYRKRVLKFKNERTTNTKKVNEFLDLEAELSQDASSDEHSDDSTGSLADFICDDAPGQDIHDIYLQSVKSPIKGVFKVPQLPPFNKENILSQFVEEDTYEMDSFCVDSHVILNETNEMSELEIAEMILKERRKAKKKKNQSNTQKDEGSPTFRKNNRNIKRQIDSDSEDSS